MTDSILPASPNWYCSKVGDANDHGDLAFGARSFVYLLNTRGYPPSFVGTLTGHTDKVTTVVFCKHSGHGSLCCTAADDSFVKVWDIRAAVVLNEHRLHQSKITCADWSSLDKDLIVSGDDKGAIVCWNYSSNESTQIFPDYGYIYCIACSPHDVKQCAIGYKQGNILLVDISNGGSIIHKLRGHDDEIHSLAWSPTIGEDIVKKKEKKAHEGVDTDELEESEDDPNAGSASTSGCLLASGSRDRTIRLWSVSKGKAVLTLTLPGKSSSFKGKMEDPSKSRVWVGLYWPKNRPREIVSSSHGGDILVWDICKPGKQKWRLMGQGDGRGHNRIVFNVMHGGDRDFNTVVTMSMDRQIILWNLASSKVVCTVPTLGGFVYSMVSSPIDAGRLAIGVGDNMIRIWNTSSPVNAYDVTVLWQGTRSKVTALCWHPHKEGHLAYGTDDGRVGIYDVLAQRPPSISSTYHKKTVYSVGWGPPCCGVEGKTGNLTQSVYSCGGDGIILQHNPYKIYDDAEDINNLIRKTNNTKHKLPQRTELAWKPDESVVAIGNDDGSVEIFLAPNLLLLCSIHVHYKIINCITWYPDWANKKGAGQSQSHYPPGASGEGQSNCRNWLAVGSNDPPIHIYDLTEILVSRTPTKPPITSSYCTLNGHTQRVTGLSWSPHGDKKLVSVSYDGTAQVWDVVKGEPVANYRGHHGRVFSAVWSGVDPDSVYTGGEDFTVQRWRASQQENVRPPKSRRAAHISVHKSVKSKGKNKNRQRQETRESQDVKTDARPVAPPNATPSSEELKMLEQFVEKRIEELKDKQTSGGDIEDEDSKKTNVPSKEEKAKDKSRAITSQLLDVVVDTKERLDEKDRVAADVAMETTSTGSVPKKGTVERKKKKPKSLFPKSSSLDNRGKNFMQEDCKLLAQSLYTADSIEGFSAGTGEHCNIGLFADRKAAFRLFKEEGCYHQEMGNLENYLQLEVWKGNIGKALQVAKEHGQLNDWLVSLAPLGGQDLWLQTAEAYARQLCLQEQFLKATSYLVACHKVYDAIDVLREHKFLKEAVALAKVRLAPSDPVLMELYQTWAAQLENDGNFEMAAKCYLACHQACDAVRLISRRGDVPALRTACQVALYANEHEQASSLALQCANQCQENADWLAAHGVLSGHKNVQVNQLQLIIHQLMVQCLLEMNSLSGDLYQDATFADWQTEDVSIPEWILMRNPSVKDYIQPSQVEDSWWEACMAHGELFYFYAIRVWCSLCCDQVTSENLAKLYQTLLIAKQMKGGQLTEKEVLLYISYDMTLALLSIMTSQFATAISHWLQAVETCHERGLYEIQQCLCRIIATQGWTTFTFLHQSLETSKGDESGDVSRTGLDSDGLYKLDCLQAHYCLLALYDMWWSKLPGSAVETTTDSDSGEKEQDQIRGIDGGIGIQCTVSDLGSVSAEAQANDVQVRDDADLLCENTKQSEISSGDASDLAVQTLETEQTGLKPTSETDQLGDGDRVYLNDKDEGACNSAGGDFSSGPPPNDDKSNQISLGPSGDAESKESPQEGDRCSPHASAKLEVISKTLLSDNYATKYALLAKLHFIQKAVKALIAQQKRQSRKEQKLKRAQRKKEQAAKAENGRENDSGSSQAQRLESETADGVESDSKVHVGGSSQAGEHDSTPLASGAGTDDSQAASVGTPDRQSDQRENTETENPNDVMLDSCSQVRINSDSTKESPKEGGFVNGESNITDNAAVECTPKPDQDTGDGDDVIRDVPVLPTDWKELPLDARYSHPGVSMTVLSDEQTEVIDQLQQLPRIMKELNFPNPVESAMVLVHYCVYKPDSVSSGVGHQRLNQCGMEAAQWGLKHSQTSQEIRFFLKHLDMLESRRK